MSNAEFSDGDIPISVFSLSCNGDEQTLYNCNVNIDNVISCGQFEDAAIICQGNCNFLLIFLLLFTYPYVSSDNKTRYDNCSTGSVRLADIVVSNTTAEGRVEVCINQAWGTVCNRRFDNDDAGTVCHLAGGFLRSGNDNCPYNVLVIYFHILFSSSF